MKRREKQRADAQFQSSEPGVELVPPVNMDDISHSLSGENTMTKFDFDSLAVAEKRQSLDDYAASGALF